MDVVRDRVSQQPTTACKVLSAASVNTCHDVPHTEQTYMVFLVRRAVALGPRDGTAAVGGAGANGRGVHQATALSAPRRLGRCHRGHRQGARRRLQLLLLTGVGSAGAAAGAAAAASAAAAAAAAAAAVRCCRCLLLPPDLEGRQYEMCSLTREQLVAAGGAAPVTQPAAVAGRPRQNRGGPRSGDGAREWRHQDPVPCHCFSALRLCDPQELRR